MEDHADVPTLREHVAGEAGGAQPGGVEGCVESVHLIAWHQGLNIRRHGQAQHLNRGRGPKVINGELHGARGPKRDGQGDGADAVGGYGLAKGAV